MALTNMMQYSWYYMQTLYNKFTETSPAFRANFIIKKINGGFSSYQSEYPFNMTTKNGSITSGTASLTSKNANKNYIIFRNIFIEPIERPFIPFFSKFMLCLSVGDT